MIRTLSWEGLVKSKAASANLKPGIELCPLSGHLLCTRGVSQINIYDTPCQFHVVDDFQHDMLLGSDALILCAANIMYCDKRVILCGRVHEWESGMIGAVVDDIRDREYWGQLYPDIFSTPVTGYGCGRDAY